MKKVVIILAMAAALIAVSSCKNANKAAEGEAAATECAACCDSTKCAACDSTKCAACQHQCQKAE